MPSLFTILPLPILVHISFILSSRALACAIFFLVSGFLFAQTRSVHKPATKKPSTTSVKKTSTASAKSVFADSFSYALGVNYARYIISQGIDIRPQDVARGMSDVLNKKTIAIDSATAQNIIQRVAREAMDRIVLAQKKAFMELLTENKKNPKVKELATGLQYEILKDTTGVVPTDSSIVTVHYTGRLMNGEVFDSSEQRGQPATFPLGQVIRGWQEVLKHMPTGAVWRVYISSDWAYGDKGYSNIPGGAGLIFDIHLLSIK